MRAFHENPNRIHTGPIFINPFKKRIITYRSSLVWVHDVCHAYVKYTFSDAAILLAFKGLSNVFCVYTEMMAQVDTVTFE